MPHGFNTFEEYDYYLEQAEREELQADYERARKDQSSQIPPSQSTHGTAMMRIIMAKLLLK